MQKFSLILILLALMVSQSKGNPVDSILVRSERYLRQTVPVEDVQNWLNTLNENGQWPDIDYSDRQAANWRMSAHLQRLRSMAFEWTDPGSTLYNQPKLKGAIDGALGHWLEKRYQNPNWWHNQIGVPRFMQDIIVLLRRDLTPEQFKGAMEVLGQHKVGGSGANLVWSADLGLHWGALANDVAMIKKCSDLLSNEISVTRGEGIQPDFSYHQHGARLQTYHYGEAFLRENIKLAWELQNTPWEFPGEKIDILVNFVLQGWQWMARGMYTVPGTVDRSVSREGVLKHADLRRMVPYLIQLKEEHAEAFKALALRQEGNGKQLQGFKYYPYSDFSAYHHADFSFFVKTISGRTRFSESINGENLKGRLLNSGDTYFMRDGMEYYNLMPAWNWEFIPGVTTFPHAQTKQQNFTGGVSNGQCGLTVMHHRAEHETKNLSVNKFWAVHRDLVVCLMADMQVQNADSVYTVMDQCRWRSDVTVNKPGMVLGAGVHALKNPTWIHHAGFAYIPLSPSNTELQLKSVTGSWSLINQSGSEQPVTEKIFMPVLLHGRSTSSGYVVAVCKTAEEARKLIEKPEWAVVRNDGECQAVLFRDGTLMAAFASPAQVRLKNKKQLSADKPCLVIVSGGKMFVSDPTRTGGAVNIRWGNKQFVFILPAAGTGVAQDI